MTKAVRQMKEDVRLVDLLIELLDARAPLSSRNPDIDELGAGKLRMVLLNKADMADERTTAAWKSYFAEKGIRAVVLDSRNRGDMKEVKAAIWEVSAAKRERDARRGIKNRPVRAMVVGIPNVGKSTFINSFAGKAVAKTGNKPGVTRGKQWIRLSKDVELLDTPGILWPKFEDQQVGLRLAMMGTVPDTLLPMDELCLELLGFLGERYPAAVPERYGIEAEGKTLSEQLAAIAMVRGCIGKGEAPDYEKAAKLVFDDFRTGRLGRVSLEEPDTDRGEEA